MKIKIFRWRAIGPLLLFLLLLGVLWILFGDWLVEDTGEEVTTELLGTQVDISGLRVRETQSRIEIGGLQIADPFNLNRNLIETGAAVLLLDPAALLEKKLVIDRLTIADLRLGTPRATPARPVSGNGFAPTLLRQVRQWSSQFDVPLLKLTPFDTVKALVLDPSQLSTVQAAKAVVSTADSMQAAFTQSLHALDLQAPLDTARAVAGRLANATPATLGIAGTREALQSVRRARQEISRAQERVKALEQGVETGIATVGHSLAAVDLARQKDYDFARSLLQLPSFAAPDIGSALFGRVSVDRFEKAVYWAELAQRYLPPGLRPHTRPAPKRLRMDGTTVRFPKEQAYPSFLLREGAINVAFSAFGASHTLTATAGGITTEPAIFGAPATVTAQGSIGGAHPMTLSVGAVIDHRGPVTHDSARVRLQGVPLPGLSLPGLPFRLDPGTGSSNLLFSMRGDQVDAAWSLSTSNAAWALDSASASSLGTLESLIWRVLSGLKQLDVTAELSGTLRAPRLAVRSNIDEAIAERVRGILGEEIQAAEQRIRAQVDSLVGGEMAKARARAEAATSALRTQVTTVKQELEQARSQLEARLRSLSGGLGGVLGG
jgi:uncharacterized protein (TIGR03545 family)